MYISPKRKNNIVIWHELLLDKGSVLRLLFCIFVSFVLSVRYNRVLYTAVYLHDRFCSECAVVLSIR